jgi:hypothetical protein
MAIAMDDLARDLNGYVLCGTLDVTVGTEAFRLQESDSIGFDS